MLYSPPCSNNVFCCDISLGTGKEAEETNFLKKLSHSCLVVDALGPSVREELVNNFCSRELDSYEQKHVGAGMLNISLGLSCTKSVFLICFSLLYCWQN